MRNRTVLVAHEGIALTRARPSAVWHSPAWVCGSGRRSEDQMITLYGFGRIFPEGRSETKDLRAQWALEETGLPYRVHALDNTGGELDGDAYSRISPFHQAPVIDDDGFVVAESRPGSAPSASTLSESA